MSLETDLVKVQKVLDALVSIGTQLGIISQEFQLYTATLKEVAVDLENVIAEQSKAK